jgi:hypothetical protein
MWPDEMEALARRARQQDLLREAERKNLIRLAELQPTEKKESFRAAAGWLGGQMVKWGLKLQDYSTASPAEEGFNSG